MKTLLSLLTVIFLSVSCSKTNDPEPDFVIDKTELELHYDESYQFVITQGNGPIDASLLDWRSSDEAVGTVDANGLFKGKRIGEVTISGSLANKLVESRITIKPYSMAWKEPVTDFGTALSTVKTKETRALLSEDNNNLVYKGESSKIASAFYLFEAGRLKSCGVVLASTAEMVKESATFLAERYTYLGKQNSFDLYSNSKTVTIGLTQDPKLGLVAVYGPYIKTGRLPAEATITRFETELGKLKQMLR